MDGLTRRGSTRFLTTMIPNPTGTSAPSSARSKNNGAEPVCTSTSVRCQVFRAELETGPLRISPASEGQAFSCPQAVAGVLGCEGTPGFAFRLWWRRSDGRSAYANLGARGSHVARVEIRELARQLKVWALDKRRPWPHLFWETVRRFLPRVLAGTAEHLRPAPWLCSSFVARYRYALAGYESRIRFFGPLPTFQENLATLDALRRQLGADELPSEPVYEKRYPYLDRDLLEFLFAVPREQLLRPGQRRSLMRRALAGVVPEEILNRKRKAFVARRPLVGIADEFEGLLQTLDPMIVAWLGIVDPIAFRRELDKARVGRGTLPIALLRTIGIEMWLRNLAAGGLLKNQAVPRGEPRIALTTCSTGPHERSFS